MRLISIIISFFEFMWDVVSLKDIRQEPTVVHANRTPQEISSEDTVLAGRLSGQSWQEVSYKTERETKYMTVGWLRYINEIYVVADDGNIMLYEFHSDAAALYHFNQLCARHRVVFWLRNNGYTYQGSDGRRLDMKVMVRAKLVEGLSYRESKAGNYIADLTGLQLNPQKKERLIDELPNGGYIVGSKRLPDAIYVYRDTEVELYQAGQSAEIFLVTTTDSYGNKLQKMHIEITDDGIQELSWQHTINGNRDSWRNLFEDIEANSSIMFYTLGAAGHLSEAPAFNDGADYNEDTEVGSPAIVENVDEPIWYFGDYQIRGIEDLLLEGTRQVVFHKHDNK